MNSYRNVLAAVLAAASMIILTTAAPTRHLRAANDDPSAEQLLQRIYTGLGLLKNFTLYELMNDSFSISNTSGIGDDHDIFKALNITCDLYRAQTELIPDIKNASSDGIVSILEKIGNESVNDSCRWLNNEIGMLGSVNCSSLSVTCAHWKNNREYADALVKVKKFNGTITNLSTDEYKLVFEQDIRKGIEDFMIKFQE